MSIPYSVAQKMLIELNDYDRLKELSKLDKKEIVELNNKVEFLNKVVQTWVEKDSLSREIISETEEKVKIYKEENEQLRDDNKRLKTKNTIFNIISGAIVAPLTYIALFK
jgi:predicted phosphohydrolase